MRRNRLEFVGDRNLAVSEPRFLGDRRLKSRSHNFPCRDLVSVVAHDEAFGADVEPPVAPAHPGKTIRNFRIALYLAPSHGSGGTENETVSLEDDRRASVYRGQVSDAAEAQGVGVWTRQSSLCGGGRRLKRSRFHSIFPTRAKPLCNCPASIAARSPTSEPFRVLSGFIISRNNGLATADR